MTEASTLPPHLALRHVGDDPATRKGAGKTYFTLWDERTLEVAGAEVTKEAFAELIDTGLLDSITELSLMASAGLEGFPTNVSRLTSVTHLRIASKGFVDGASAYGLASLERLSIEGSAPTALPEGIAALRSLRELEIKSKKVTSLPPDLDQLPALERVKVSKALQPALDALELLCVLGSLREGKRYGYQFGLHGELLLKKPARGDQLARLAEAGRLDEVRSIELHASAELESLPESLARLPELRSLTVQSAHFRDWSSLYALASLETLVLAGKAAGRLPAGLTRLSRLRSFVIRASGIESVPRELAEMPWVERLDVPPRLSQERAEIVAGQRMRRLLARFEVWLAEHDADYLAGLAPGLDAEALGRLEAEAEVELPEDVRALYRWRAGDPREDGRFVFFRIFLTPSHALRERKQLLEMLRAGQWSVEGVQAPGMWSEHWFPLFRWDNGLHVCSDLAGSYGGARGQVLEVWMKDDDRVVVAPDLASWFEGYVAALEAGELQLEGGEWDWKGRLAPRAFHKRLPKYPKKKSTQQAP